MRRHSRSVRIAAVVGALALLTAACGDDDDDGADDTTTTEEDGRRCPRTRATVS